MEFTNQIGLLYAPDEDPQPLSHTRERALCFCGAATEVGQECISPTSSRSARHKASAANIRIRQHQIGVQGRSPGAGCRGGVSPCRTPRRRWGLNREARDKVINSILSSARTPTRLASPPALIV